MNECNDAAAEQDSRKKERERQQDKVSFKYNSRGMQDMHVRKARERLGRKRDQRERAVGLEGKDKMKQRIERHAMENTSLGLSFSQLIMSCIKAYQVISIGIYSPLLATLAMVVGQVK